MKKFLDKLAEIWLGSVLLAIVFGLLFVMGLGIYNLLTNKDWVPIAVIAFIIITLAAGARFDNEWRPK